MKISKQELKECIIEAVCRVINEGWDKFGDTDALLAQQLANDKKAGWARGAANKAGNLGLSKEPKKEEPVTDPSQKKGRGRPKGAKNKDKSVAPSPLQFSEKDDEAMIKQMGDEEEKEEQAEKAAEEAENNEKAYGDNEDIPATNKDYYNMSTAELKQIIASRHSVSEVRFATTELKERESQLEDYLEAGIKPFWGYIYNKETNTIEPDPRHANLGKKSSDAWNPGDVNTSMIHKENGNLTRNGLGV